MYFSPGGVGFVRRTTGSGLVKAVDGVDLEIRRGKTLGLVGESGCGKTTVGRCILKLYRLTEGKIFFQGEEISQLPEHKFRSYRRLMQPIFQDPYGSLNPRQTARSIIGEPLKVHRISRNISEYRDRIEQLFRTVGLDPSMLDRYPHEFSGGQRQRIGIARALASEPLFIVSDEPVSALDVSIRGQIVNLLGELQENLGLTQLFISHDLSVVRHISHKIAIMYLGHIIEIAESAELYVNPIHPYTQALLSAVPIPDPFIEEMRGRIMLKGDVPSPVNPPAGCAFHPRCSFATADCSRVVPHLRELDGDHMVACINV